MITSNICYVTVDYSKAAFALEREVQRGALSVGKPCLNPLYLREFKMDRGGVVARFAYEIPSVDSYWRAIVLFGQNVASCKFALAGALREVGAGSEVVSLDELALPFASRVAAHLRTHDKQETFQQSRFLDACRAYNSGELDADRPASKDCTAQLRQRNRRVPRRG